MNGSDLQHSNWPNVVLNPIFEMYFFFFCMSHVVQSDLEPGPSLRPRALFHDPWAVVSSFCGAAAQIVQMRAIITVVYSCNWWFIVVADHLK